MKRHTAALLILCTMICAALALSGCSGPLDDLFARYETQNPTAGPPIGMDEDGDGLADYYAQDLDADGRADTDPATGEIVEISGTRQAVQIAAEQDSALSELFYAVAALGVPGVAVLGGWVARRKPAQRLQQQRALLGELVRNIQTVRQNVEPEIRHNLDRLFERLHSPELGAEIDLTKAAQKAAQRRAEKAPQT